MVLLWMYANFPIVFFFGSLWKDAKSTLNFSFVIYANSVKVFAYKPTKASLPTQTRLGSSLGM